MSRELFGPEKPFIKLRPAYSVKLVFSYVVKGIKIKITAKFRASRRLRFEDRKRIMSPEIRPKSFGTFEKQAVIRTLTSAMPVKFSTCWAIRPTGTLCRSTGLWSIYITTSSHVGLIDSRPDSSAGAGGALHPHRRGLGLTPIQAFPKLRGSWIS